VKRGREMGAGIQSVRERGREGERERNRKREIAVGRGW